MSVGAYTNPGGRMKTPPCKSTALRRCMATEMRWNKDWGYLSWPLKSKIHRPKSYINRTQCLERDRLKVVVSLQSDIFRLFARGCHLRHTARTVQGEIKVRVSRGANNYDVPRQGPAAFKTNQRSRDHLVSWTSWRSKLTGSLANGTPAATKALATRSFSMWCLDDLPGGLFADKAVHCADHEGRPASRIGEGAGHTHVSTAKLP